MQDAARSAAGSGTPHYNVSCQSCRVSKTFVTMQGVNSFVMEHDGHVVIEGRLFENPLAAKGPAVVAKASEQQMEDASEVVAAPAEADIEVEPPREENPEVVAMSEEPDPQDAIPEEAPEVAAAPAGVVDLEEPEAEAAPEVAAAPEEEVAQEMMPQGDVPEIVAAPVEVAVQELEPETLEAPAAVFAPSLAAAQVIEPQAEEIVQDAVHVEEPTPARRDIQRVEARVKELVTPASPILSENDLKEPLLLARSSYIGESEENRMDALKVSRALKEFRWNIEPPYVIGVMVDDNLSVETNIGVVSTAMVARVERLGYKFVAVNAPQGSPVAWFKREAPDAPEKDFTAGDPERMMQIHHGKRTYDGDKAVWEESFVSLLMSVKDMDGQKLKHVTEIIKAEQPEPDISS